MKRRLRVALCIVALATRAWGGPFEDGAKAYDEGRFDSALALWKPLAEQGHAAAQFNLAILYEKGQGVPQDYTEALYLFNRAVTLGSADAEAELGYMYRSGYGVCSLPCPF